MSAATETHYSPQQVAEMWGVSDKTVQRMFEDAVGVLKISLPTLANGRKRKPRVKLRIPASVLERLHDQRAAGFRAEIKRGGRGVE
jgi:hypothetical protein